MSALLLSVDLEDVRDWVKDGYSYREAVPENTRRYLEQFRAWGVRATFFVVGRVARRYPELLEEIVDAGHELACHGDMHLQLDKLSPREFHDDLRKNLAALQLTGTAQIHGFRAPTFSLTQKTAWAHDVLADLGFTYSSSVLPAANPLYGWPEFGRNTRKLSSGIWELPITLRSFPGLQVPIAGGVYFRVLPFVLTRWEISRCLGRGEPVGTYFHPYDIDTGQERFMHPDLDEKKHLNMLMYIGRAKVFKRLAVLKRSFPFQSYGEYVSLLEKTSPES
jgi:polysaccharide deacetylase family protein (PEP-CTERM system associated)